MKTRTFYTIFFKKNTHINQSFFHTIVYMVNKRNVELLDLLYIISINIQLNHYFINYPSLQVIVHQVLRLIVLR